MTDPEQPAATGGGTTSGAPSLGALVQALIADAQTVVEAEAGYWQALVAFVLQRARTIAILLAAALFLVFFALMAVVVGLLLALAPIVGAWIALGIVAGPLAVATAGCVLIAVRRAKQTLLVLKRGGADKAQLPVGNGQSEHG